MRKLSPARKLAAARSLPDRRRIVRGLSAVERLAAARELKKLCYDVWTSEPSMARSAAAALAALAAEEPSAEIRGHAAWADGIAELTRSRLESAAERLGNSAAIYRKAGLESESAGASVALMMALALLGRLDEAVRTGRRALRIFESTGDELSAGKIEINLANIVSRRARHREAERYGLSAVARFRGAGLPVWETLALNGLANTYAELDDFRSAERFYSAALKSAVESGMSVTEAEIEASLGNLALSRGRFDEALRLFETSRSKFSRLRMPHQTAIADLETADIYLELNLIAEAAGIFRRAASVFRRLGLPSEEARARSGSGRAAAAFGEWKRARTELERSYLLFSEARDPVGAGAALLANAKLEIDLGKPESGLAKLRQASRFVARGGNSRQAITLRWLRGLAAASAGRRAAARRELEAGLESARGSGRGDLEIAILNSLGRLALDDGDDRRAESLLNGAIRLIEGLRDPLPGEEFRMAFFAARTQPYEDAARLHLRREKVKEAFEMTERARARTIFESISAAETQKFSEDEAARRAREDLNWFYSRLAKATPQESRRLESRIRKAERAVADLGRRAAGLRRSESSGDGTEFASHLLQTALGPGRALVEYTRFEGSVSAFVATENDIVHFPDIAAEDDIRELTDRLRFQFGALRYGAAHLGPLEAQLKSRADAYLGRLHRLLIEPLAGAFGERDLVIVPAGGLNYVPFGALRSERYLIEERAVVIAPSAAVWLALESKPRRPLKSAFVIGYADEKIPLVDREIAAVAARFPGSQAVSGEAATFEAFIGGASGKDVVHIACHGQFRPDNPLFSSLRLSDGFVTVRDLCARRIDAAVVTLSACETGLSRIAGGEEVLGLARGFLGAGAENLVLSLWTVSDTATARLMSDFYGFLPRSGVAGALRRAQIRFIERGEHPYFWAPFTAAGR